MCVLCCPSYVPQTSLSRPPWPELPAFDPRTRNDGIKASDVELGWEIGLLLNDVLDTWGLYYEAGYVSG